MKAFRASLLLGFLLTAGLAPAQTLQLIATNTGGGNIRAPINEQGQVVYQNFLDPLPGLRFGMPGVATQAVVASHNDLLPGALQFVISGFPGYQIANGTNRVAYFATGGSLGYGGLFMYEGGTTHRVAVSSNQAPGLPVGVMFSVSSAGAFVAMNSNGNFIVVPGLTGTGVVATSNDFAIFKGPATNLQLVARAGAAAPGYPAGWVFAANSGFAGHFGVGARMNGAGTAVFAAAAYHTNAFGTFSNAYWLHDANGLRPIIRFDQSLTSGQPAPGVSNAFFYDYTPAIRINDAGEIAFNATAIRLSPFLQADGIWAGPTNNLRPVVLSGQPAPGAGGANFATAGVDLRFVLGTNGVVCFRNTITGAGVNSTNNSVLCVGSSTNNLRLLARTGAQPPGLPAGSYYTSLVINNDNGSAPVIFGTNRVAFTAFARTPDAVTRQGLWVTDANGDVQLVFAEGLTLLELTPGVFRTPGRFYFNGGSGMDGSSTSINRRGQLAVNLEATGLPVFTGTYIVDFGAEPSTSGSSSFGTVQFLPGTGFEMNLAVEAGKMYRVQYLDQLGTTNWMTLQSFTSSGTATQIVDSVIAPNRYYRVISP